MDITPEQLDALYEREEPDVRICLHDLRIVPVNTVEGEHPGTPGFIARMVGHGADGEPMTIDFATSELTLIEVVNRCTQAGMESLERRAVEFTLRRETGCFLDDLRTFRSGQPGTGEKENGK